MRIAEAPSHRMSIFEYDENARGATDYLNLAREVLQWKKPKQMYPAPTEEGEPSSAPPADAAARPG